MKLKTKIYLLAGALLLIIISSSITEYSGNQQLSDKQISQELDNSTSFANETALTIDQYLQDKVSFTYLKIHVEHLTKKLLQFYSHFESLKLPPENEPKLKNLAEKIFNLSLKMKSIENTDGDKQKLENIKKEIEQIKLQLQKEDS
jgi:hypothetical protein